MITILTKIMSLSSFAILFYFVFNAFGTKRSVPRKIFTNYFEIKLKFTLSVRSLRFALSERESRRAALEADKRFARQ